MVRRLLPTDPEWSSLFQDFDEAVFRLETLQTYAVPYEQQALQRFLAGEPKPSTLDVRYEWWRGLIRAGIAEGKSFRRVRIVEEPLTTYTRFELAWAYPENVDAGEDVRIWRTRSGAALPGPVHDFWLFDERVLARMNYDAKGHFLHVDLVEDRSEIEAAIRIRDRFLVGSIPFRHYVRGLDEPEVRARAL